MTDRSQPDRAQHTAPESMPPAAASTSPEQSSAVVGGGSSAASEGVTGDNDGPGQLGGTDDYPDAGASPDRGGSAAIDRRAEDEATEHGGFA